MTDLAPLRVVIEATAEPLRRAARQAVGDLKGFGAAASETGKQVSGFSRLAAEANGRLAASYKSTVAEVARGVAVQRAEFVALGQAARAADRAIIDQAAQTLRSTATINRALDSQIAKQRELGMSYARIAAEQKKQGTAAAETAAAIERSSAAEVAAMRRTSGAGGVGAAASMAAARRQRMAGGRASLAENAVGARLTGGGMALGGALGLAIGGGMMVGSVNRAQDIAHSALSLRSQTGLSQDQALQLAVLAQARDIQPRTIGMSFATAGTQLQHALAGNKTAIAGFDQLGISMGQARGMQNNLPGLVDLIYSRLQRQPQAARAALGRQFLGRGASALGPLLADGSITGQMAQAGRDLPAMDPKKLEELHRQSIQLKMAMTGLQLAFVQAFGPAISALLKAITPAMRPIGEALAAIVNAARAVPGPVKDFVKVFGGVIVVALAVAEAVKVAQAAMVLLDAAALANPWTLAIAAIAAGAYVIIKNWRPVSQFFTELWAGIKQTVADAVDWVGGHWKLLVPLVLGPFGLIIDGAQLFGPKILHTFTDAFDAVVKFIAGLPGTFLDLGKNIVGGLVDGIKAAPSALMDALKSLLPGPLQGALGTIVNGAGGAVNAIANAFAGGGWVPGDPNRDGTLALLAGNEFVVTGHGQQMMEEHAPGLLDAIAGGQLPHFASGGRVKAAGHPGSLSFTGKVSVFGPPTEPGTGEPWKDSVPGIALRSMTNLRKGNPYLVTIAGHSALLPQTDWGPAAWTGRAIDVTGAGAKRLGFDPMRFPTDATGSAVEWLGKSPGRFLNPRSSSGGGVFSLSGDVLSPQDALSAGFQAGLRGDGLAGAVKQITDSIAGTTSSGGGGTSGSSTAAGGTGWRGLPKTGLKAGIVGVASQIMGRWPGLSVTSTTHGNHVPGSLHYQGRAVDLAGSGMDQASGWIKQAMAPLLTEGIHNPNLAVKNGQTFQGQGPFGAVWAGHRDHIHVAKRRGGWVGRVPRFNVGGAVQHAARGMARNPFGGIDPYHAAKNRVFAALAHFGDRAGIDASYPRLAALSLADRYRLAQAWVAQHPGVTPTLNALEAAAPAVRHRPIVRPARRTSSSSGGGVSLPSVGGSSTVTPSMPSMGSLLPSITPAGSIGGLLGQVGQEGDLGTAQGQVNVQAVITSLGTLVGDMGRVTLARLTPLAVSLRKEIAKLKQQKASPIRIADVTAALDAVQAAVGQRIGTMVQTAEDQMGRIDQSHATLGNRGHVNVQQAFATAADQATRRQGLSGVDLTRSQIGEVGSEQSVLQTGLAGLNRALGAALHNGAGQDVVKDILQRISDTSDRIAEDGTRQIELSRQLVSDQMQHRDTMANLGLTGLQLSDKLAGKSDSQTAADSAAYITSTVLPALQADLAALQGLPESASRDEQIQSKQNDILQAQLDAQQQIRDAAAAQAAALQGVNDLLKAQLENARKDLAVSQGQYGALAGFQPLFSQRMVGSFDRGADSVMATGLALVHRGERITPYPDGPYGNRAPAVEPPVVNVHLGGDLGPLVDTFHADVDGRALRMSQQIGRRQRRIMAAPGR